MAKTGARVGHGSNHSSIITAVCLAVGLVCLAAATPALAQSGKYMAEDIGAKNTCQNDDPAKSVKDCMQEFGEKFCKENGHNTYVMVNWESTGEGYSDPTSIYCK